MSRDIRPAQTTSSAVITNMAGMHPAAEGNRNVTSATRTLRALAATAVIAAVAVAALAASGTIELKLADQPELGAALADGNGNSLYLFSSDAQGESKCYDSCATNWPPLITTGDVNLGEGLDAALVGTIPRTDGSSQVTYGGWPLYFFVGDTAAGMAAGHGLNEVWFLVTAEGTAVPVDAAQESPAGETAEEAAEEPTEEPAGEAGADDELFAAYMTEGAKVFATICAACHGAQGNEELSTHVAILEGNSRVENARLVIRRVIHGGTYMPPFGDTLSDREVAAVATFVRNSFGNEYGFVGEEEAAAMR